MIEKGMHRATDSSWPKARRVALGIAAATAVGGAGLALSTVGASAATPHAAAANKVTICHRTDSETNPYVTETIADAAALDAHLKVHTGDVWFPGHAKEPKWGDIIPSFSYKGHSYSLNWTQAGAAIWNNGCKPVEASTSPTSESTSPTSESSSPTSESSSPTISTEPSSSTPVSLPPSSDSSTPPTEESSSNSSAASGVNSSKAQSSSAAAGGNTTSANAANANGVSSEAPIPAAANAGLHARLTNSGMKAWGAVLMLLGGLGGVLVGAWPTRRRAH